MLNSSNKMHQNLRDMVHSKIQAALSLEPKNTQTIEWSIIIWRSETSHILPKSIATFLLFLFPSENLMNCYINMSYHCKSYIILSQYSTGEIHFVNPLLTITGFTLVSNKNIKENLNYNLYKKNINIWKYSHHSSCTKQWINSMRKFTQLSQETMPIHLITVFLEIFLFKMFTFSRERMIT